MPSVGPRSVPSVAKKVPAKPDFAAQKKPARIKPGPALEIAVMQEDPYRLCAAATSFSTVMPSSFITVPPGALMPKRSMPTTLPSRPTY